MSTALADLTASTPTASTPTVASLWRTWRAAAAVAAAVVLGAVVIGLLGAGGAVGVLDPEGVDQGGSRALAQLLGANGVAVIRTEGVAATSKQAREGDTVLVIGPDLLTVEQATELRSTGANLVVLAATRSDILAAFLPGVVPGEIATVKARDPGCELEAAVMAGRALTGGVTYSAGGAVGATSCYPTAQGSALLQITESGGRTVTFLGTSTPLRNDRLAREGDAALAMNLLGADPRLVWAMPLLEDLPVEPAKPLTDLFPRWVVPATVQLFVGVVLIALWRARRLGPVVEEPLPVVVRAAEATEGRARLYRRAHDRGRAAAHLRRAALTRMAPLVGLPGPVHVLDPTAVVTALASRSHRSESEVRALLYGGEPADDAALLTVATGLDALEREVRRP